MGDQAQLGLGVSKMKTVVFIGLVALALAGASFPQSALKTKNVDAEFVLRQKKVLALVEHIYQIDTQAEYYKIGQEYNFESNINGYTNKKAFEEFLYMYKNGFMPKQEVFSMYYETQREEAIALFKLFFYAKDFDTFYKTACWARIYMNEGQFLYAYSVAVFHRLDCKKFVLPAPYELYPQMFSNKVAMNYMYRVKMQDGITMPETATNAGVVQEGDSYVFYSNYSTSLSYSFGEERLSYFTEDVGLNSHYYYFQTYWPFWMKGEEFGVLQKYRGDFIYIAYQNILARYYLERLSNGLGEIPKFSWYYPIKYGYSPLMSNKYPIVQRNDYYSIQNEENFDDLHFLDSYEKTFLQFIEKGQFKAFDQEIDLQDPKAINFVASYWQSNADLYKKEGFENYMQSYELTAHKLLSASPKEFDDYYVTPGAMEYYQTSLRDPMFYQYYSKVLGYFLKFKEQLPYYTQDYLRYVGVKINDVQVSKLVTYFDFFDFSLNNGIYYDSEEFKTFNKLYKIRQPRLNHKHFDVTVDVKSEVTGDAIVKFFLGPKYDSNGYPINIEDNWMNFYVLDVFKFPLKAGQNKIVRNSQDFFYFNQDAVSMHEFYKYLDQGKVPTDMSENRYYLPNRMMLPKGTYGGFPVQLFVIVFPYEQVSGENQSVEALKFHEKPFGYPFDRPVTDGFYQPNMFFENVEVYHEGEYFPYVLNTPEYFTKYANKF